jgi:hypothetical protein
MGTYRLDQFERGSLRLPSGDWRWFVIRLVSLPEGKCELQQLIFVSEQGGLEIMRARVPNDVNIIDDASARDFARHPEDRTIRAQGGSITVRPPDDQEPNPVWKVRPENGHPFRTSYAVEKPLGELTHDDMLRIIRR